MGQVRFRIDLKDENNGSGPEINRAGQGPSERPGKTGKDRGKPHRERPARPLIKTHAKPEKEPTCRVFRNSAGCNDSSTLSVSSRAFVFMGSLTLGCLGTPTLPTFDH
ncbi:MAG: hypothetical protein CL917_17970 [Deltaproteobacteria bacterium]|nr:hypothetical protein [Deltaproteobacteria bacterium]